MCLVPQRHHPVWNQPDNEHDEEESGATGFLELDDIQPRTRRQLFLCSISIMDSVVDHFQFTKCLLLEVRTHYESAQDTHHCVHLRLTLRSFVHPTFQDFTFDSLVVELMCARTVARRKCVSTMILECHSTYSFFGACRINLTGLWLYTEQTCLCGSYDVDLGSFHRVMSSLKLPPLPRVAASLTDVYVLFLLHPPPSMQ